jgi:C-terminal processing protease CtpA/Prc
MKPAALVLSLALLTPLFAADKAPASPENEVLVLEPMKVHGTATSSFSIYIRIVITPDTRKVMKIFITRVVEDGDAAEAGLEAGDEIVKIDGLPVEGMDSRLDPSSLLGRTLMNRRPGAPLRLELRTLRTEKVTLHAQSEAPLPFGHP